MESRAHKNVERDIRILFSTGTVLDELYKAIAFGTVDPDTYQPQLVQRLKDAGVEKILAEKQKQLDAWKAGK